MYVIIYITAPDITCARSIAFECIAHKLIACANILPQIESIYCWDGKIINENEIAIFLKTTEEKASKVVDLVKQIHPYKCPCIVSIPITAGNPEFLRWISDGTTY